MRPLTHRICHVYVSCVQFWYKVVRVRASASQVFPTVFARCLSWVSVKQKQQGDFLVKCGMAMGDARCAMPIWAMDMAGYSTVSRV